MEIIHWYNYVAAFFAGVFLTNVIPHFVQGISGNTFPTPFARPPGKGLSSPLTNTLWALINLVVGYLLFQGGRMTSDNKLQTFVFFAGIVAISTLLTINFSRKMKNDGPDSDN